MPDVNNGSRADLQKDLAETTRSYRERKARAAALRGEIREARRKEKRDAKRERSEGLAGLRGLKGFLGRFRLRWLAEEEARREISRLRRENRRLRVYETGARTTAGILAGRELRQSWRDWAAASEAAKRPLLLSQEAADLGSAIVRRLVRVTLVAMVPIVLWFWQNLLVAQQTAAFREDSIIARRAQLIATLYDTDCSRKATTKEAQPAPEEREEEDGLHGDEQPSDAGEEACPPRADHRSREEAVKAFIALERREPRMWQKMWFVVVGEVPERKAVNLDRSLLGGVSLWRGDLESISLAAANLAGADLRAADLRGANLDGANLSDANLLNADLSDAKLLNADLRDANLQGANFSDADLGGANLQGANLTGAILSDADLRGADLTIADLTGARVTRADLRGANLLIADLTDADLTDARVTQEQIESAIGNVNTKLPEGVTHPGSWREQQER